MSKKIIKLADRRSLTGETTKELRAILRDIDNNDVVNISLAVVHRDSTFRLFTDGDSTLRALGAIDLLRDHVKGNLK